MLSVTGPLANLARRRHLSESPGRLSQANYAVACDTRGEHHRPQPRHRTLKSRLARG